MTWTPASAENRLASIEQLRTHKETVVPAPTVSVASDRIQCDTDDLNAFLDGQDATAKYSTPIEAPLGYTLRGRYAFADIIVATETLCDASAGSGDATTLSPHALIQDPYHGLVVVADGSASVSAGTPTATLAVEALDRPLPYAFALTFNNVVVQVDNASGVAQGATSITIRRTTADVSISATDEGTPSNRYVSQKTTGCVVVKDRLLVGRPTTFVNEDPSEESARTYDCDGINLPGPANSFENVIVVGFPGAGIVQRKVGDTNTRAGRYMPHEGEVDRMHNTEVYRCLAGRVHFSVDAEMTGYHVAEACRDYGDHFRQGSVTNVGANIHDYGCSVGVMSEGITRMTGHVECETCERGAVFASGSTFGCLLDYRAYDNTDQSLEVYVNAFCVWRAVIEHDVTNKPCLKIGRFADDSAYGTGQMMLLPTGSARGVEIGDSNARTLERIDANLRIVGHGNTAVFFVCPLSGGRVYTEVEETGGTFVNGFYWADSTGLTGLDWTAKGPGTLPIRWTDGTTGTLAAPAVPAVAMQKNRLAFAPDGGTYTEYIGAIHAGYLHAVSHRTQRATVTYSTSMTVDAAAAGHFVITANDGVAFAINAPSNPSTDGRIMFTIRNTHSGALGTVTWNAVFKMASWTSPSNGFSRSIEFIYDGTNWIEVSRTPADVPN